mmetsp:Transcript_31201/g.47788  ORF Transcript_31201/g.47788 Transcript_31201/m.47788 type:complete len:484 (+) Transcript_31201:84-1535(+)
MVSIKSTRSKPSKPWMSYQLALISFVLLCLSFNLYLAKSWRNEVKTDSVISQGENPTSTTSQVSKSVTTGPPVIAHVVSLIKCSKKASTDGFLDAAAVLRHSIHKVSYHKNKSAYSYQMYAIIHSHCQQHAPVLEKFGYKTLIKDTPVKREDIKGQWYRDHVESENCCGSAEFIKLYAYTLTEHPVVVHWDMDVAILKPLDDLFDAILYDKTSDRGKTARANLELQHPEVPLPDKIDAFITRDITSAQPWEKVQGVQGGFLVSKPDPSALQTYIEFITEGNYVKGRNPGSGWADHGNGGFQGAMAYQGVVAYFYDKLRPNTAVELNVCRWNQVVADVIWRGPTREQHKGQCREYPLDGNFTGNVHCEDCRVTPIDLVRTVHYTACKKPWECAVPHPRVPRNKKQVYRLSHLTNITTCMNLHRKWFELREDFEEELQKASGVVPAKRDGTHEEKYFMGYCKRPGQYITMELPPENFDIGKIYGW